jgi:hypothetical protein
MIAERLVFVSALLFGVSHVCSATEPVEQVQEGFWRVDPVLPSVRETYEAPEYYNGPDGWIQGYPSPKCSSSKTCVANGCETHALRWSWEDPREEPTWPTNLIGCECSSGRPAYVSCLYEVD